MLDKPNLEVGASDRLDNGGKPPNPPTDGGGGGDGDGDSNFGKGDKRHMTEDEKYVLKGVFCK